MASLSDVRSTFLGFFADRDHEVVASSPLVPRNDPTLLFTNAGMVQFKNAFTGQETRATPRAATSQKCVRAGGKHNDLDNVGYTARHHTFFEMLGNFSFGDYFKEQAIPYAWELLTKHFDLPAEKLLVTVYHDDEDAVALWKKVTGFSDEKIIRIATSDNFWSMGATGPCGPCSEIFYDHGPSIPGGPPGSPDEDGDRFIEIWNLVFMQFEQFEDDRREPLPKPSIDTGMGLERVGAVLQGKHDNYDTDLMRALIEAAAQLAGPEPDGPGRNHYRVIADHLRSTAFLIADGVSPSNEGRGYVLRRIMRRAMRHAHLLGVDAPLMWRLTGALVREMGQAFPELTRAQALIEETLRLEETRFRTTLERGLRLLDDELGKLGDGQTLPGDAAFKLYDTYGFPLDLTQDALREKGRAVDVAGFDAAMAEQKARARAAWTGAGGTADEAVWLDLREELGPTEFLGYSALRAEGRLDAVVVEGARRDALDGAGAEGHLVFNQTPFYAEAGGQQADHGEVVGPAGRARVLDVRKQADGVFAHRVELVEGRIAAGDAAELSVDAARRARICANHSATHLLHEALRGALGDHVAQRGSLVAPDRLRFDFAHAKAMTEAEIAAVEAEVNRYIRQNNPVETRSMTPEEAQAQGARALFGEKYGAEVRVVSMGRRPEGEAGPAGGVYSMELCGGVHVGRTGEIGLLRVVNEAASASGVRRVEALTGAAALDYLDGQERRLRAVAGVLKSAPDEAAERVGQLLEERKKLTQEVAELRKQLALGGGAGAGGGAEAAPETKDVAGAAFLAQALEGVSPKDLRGLVDAHKQRLGSGVILLIAGAGGKAAAAVGVTEDLTAKVSAVDLVRAAATALGGSGGGGRPDMAQAGGSDPSKAPDAIAAAEAELRRAMER
ncbi:MAG: alanine--tRNA ligase [Pseudomonadota bacterium]